MSGNTNVPTLVDGEGASVRMLNRPACLLVVVFLARPEVLYGGSTLAALRMQRNTLRKLYCTYSKSSTRIRGEGFSRPVFLKVSLVVVGAGRIIRWWADRNEHSSVQGTPKDGSGSILC